MSSTALAVSAEPIKEADPVTAMITAADTLPGVSAYPAEVRASEENGVYRLEKVYYLTAKDDPATIPTADFEREGRTYTLLDLLKNDQTETDTREHIEVVTLESKTKDMAEILKMLEPKLEVKTEDGYEGVLSLDHTTIQVEAAGYGTSSRTVTAERTYPNLSDADVSLVPKSVNENGRTLTLADVSWQEAAVDPTDGYDIPIRYTAVASYTGTATSKYATGYTVTADYKGDVTRTSCDTIPLEAWCCGHREEVTMSIDHSSPYKSLAGKRTYTVEEIAKILGIGRTAAYSLVHSGVFKAVRIGSSIRVSKVSFDDWLDKQNM
jgi:excisionase family DNA binding protein